MSIDSGECNYSKNFLSEFNFKSPIKAPIRVDKGIFIGYNITMEKIWVNKANSFRKAAEFDAAYYARMTNAQRINAMQFLREIYHKLKPSKNENGKRLRRVIKIIDKKQEKVRTQPRQR